jgi:PAS domain S-box-containing protein
MEISARARLLVIDDNEIKRRGVARVLRAADYEIVEAATGADGLRLAQETMPDLILLDRLLPDIDGVEVCRQLKTGAHTSNLFVVFLSASQTSSDSQAAGLEGGADGYVAHPVGNRELVARVEAMLRIKRAEDHLRESEEHFRIVADFTHDWEYWVGVDGRHLYVSPSCERVTGYRADEFMQDPDLLRAIVHPEDRAVLDQHLLERFEGDEGAALDFRILTRGGEERWVNHVCQPVYGAGGRWLGRRASNRDITERVRAEDEIRSLSRLPSENPNSILRLGRDGVILYANEASAPLLAAWQSSVGQKAPEAVQAAAAGALESGAVAEIELAVAGRIFAFVLAPVSGEGYANLYGQDITRRKRAEELLKQRAAQLATLNDVGSKIATVLDLDSVLDRAVRLVQGSFGYHHVGLFTLDRKQGALVMKARAGDFEPLFPPDHRLKLGQGMVGWAAQCGKTLLADDVRAEPRYVNPYPGVVPTVSELSVPIRVSEEVVGVLDIQSPQIDAFDENDVPVMETLANQIAVAIENARLYEAVRRELAERKRTESQREAALEALRRSEERFRLAAECLSDVIYEWDIGDSVQWFGDIDGLLGYAPGEFPRTLQAFSESLHPEDRERVRDARERHLKGEAAYAVEYRIRHNDGTWRQWQARGMALRDVSGKPYRWIGAVTDITRQKRAEVQLQESEARVHFLADVLEHASQPFAVGYLDGRLGVFNTAYRNLVGYSQAEMQAMDWSADLTPPEWREIEAEHLEKLQRTGQPVRYEKEYLRKDGSRVPIELLMHLVRDETGAPQYYYAFVDDLTERKRAEQMLQRYSQRLEEMVAERTRELYVAQDRLVRQEKLATLGQLAGGVGHELRNPLGAIKNAAYFLNLALPKPEPEVKETLDILHREVAASERIIGSLLGFARPRPPARQPVEINALVREALARTALPENVRVVTHLGEALPAIPADPDQLVQVFGNLILNAAQAMPDGGRLTVETRVEPEVEWLAVSVADTGMGISPENLGKLFEPLFSTKAQGIGLGLALSKTLVENHGGRIEVRSEVGAGSIFTVKLPINQQKAG